MNRDKLKCGGKRHKALFGADGAIMAAATLTAAGMTTAATAAAANKQAKSIVESAKTQADSIKEQSENNTNLQKEQLEFTRAQNKENRQQQQDIQTTLQLLAGQQNMNDRLEQNKKELKFGGSKRQRLVNMPYNGIQFKVTDGGGVIPLNIDQNGYGLYELYGNDHEHYHKTKNGKYKTGVGIKFNDGSIVEGEGNQNTNQGELLYVTPKDAMFISKHNINGFNPAKSVINGLSPEQAFYIQELIKNKEGLNDDGSKAKRKSIKKVMGGLSPALMQANFTQDPSNGTGPVVGGVAYITNKNKTQDKPIVAKNGTRIQLKRGGKRIKCGSGGFWQNYGGATIGAAGNIGGGIINMIGNTIASNKLASAYQEAGGILADAYSQMKGIDLSEVSMEDYAAPHSIAVVRGPSTNINPQLERIRRNASSERRAINNATLSSAARQQKLAETNDRMYQRMGEQYAYKQNADERVKQENAARITQVSQDNANRDAQARQNYANTRLSLMQYNNNIENSKIAGIAQSRADSITQSSSAQAQGLQHSMNAIGAGLQSAGNQFASTYDNMRTEKENFTKTYMGLGNEDKVQAAILRFKQTGDASFINSLLEGNAISDEERASLNKVLETKKKK